MLCDWCSDTCSHFPEYVQISRHFVSVDTRVFIDNRPFIQILDKFQNVTISSFIFVPKRQYRQLRSIFFRNSIQIPSFRRLLYTIWPGISSVIFAKRMTGIINRIHLPQ